MISRITERQTISIENVGLVVIIQTKNFHALKELISINKYFFLDFNTDIIDSVLLIALKQWQQGLELLLPSFEIAFSHLSILEKFDLV